MFFSGINSNIASTAKAGSLDHFRPVCSSKIKATL